MSAIGITRQMDTLLKKREILRDEEGRFEAHGQAIKKTAKNKMKGELTIGTGLAGPAAGRGRPKGSPNKLTANLKAMILGALDKVGGEAYLQTLAVENSSAFAGLLGKILPAVLAADGQSNGGPAVIRFERVIVMPDGTKHIEGKTPKALPKPIDYVHQIQVSEAPPPSHDLPKDASEIIEPNEIKDLD